MINKDSIVTAYDEHLTLVEWLQKVETALKDAVLTGVTINKKGNATLSFVFTFEDGTTLETDDLILQQGESVASAYISNGNLHLVLTNGDDLDAGNMFNGNVEFTGTLKGDSGIFEIARSGYLKPFSPDDDVDEDITSLALSSNAGDFGYSSIQTIFAHRRNSNGKHSIVVFVKLGLSQLTPTATNYTIVTSGALSVSPSVARKIYTIRGENLHYPVGTNPIISVSDVTSCEVNEYGAKQANNNNGKFKLVLSGLNQNPDKYVLSIVCEAVPTLITTNNFLVLRGEINLMLA